MELTSVTTMNEEGFSGLLLEEDKKKIFQGEWGAIGAIEERRACGVLVYEMRNQEMIFIRDLFVREEFRRKGAARLLLNYIGGLALDNEIPLVCSYPKSEEEVLTPLFQKCGFDVQLSGSQTYRISINDLGEEYILDQYTNYSACKLISQIPRKVWNEFTQRQRKEGYFFASNCEAQRQDWLEQGCLCTVRNDRVMACTIIMKRGEADYQMAYCYVSSEAKTDIIMLLSYAQRELLKIAGKDRYLYITVINNESKNLMKKLFPKVEQTQEYMSAEMIGGEKEWNQ